MLLYILLLYLHALSTLEAVNGDIFLCRVTTIHSTDIPLVSHVVYRMPNKKKEEKATSTESTENPTEMKPNARGSAKA